MEDLYFSTAVLMSGDGVGSPTFRGTAFAFRKRYCFVTAAHCVGQLGPEELFVASAVLSSGKLTPVNRIIRHPTADLAIVVISDAGTAAVRPFYMIAKTYGYGSELGALGYPEDSASTGGMKPTGRFFRGYLQRVFQHTSHLGFSYAAAELSFAAPGGLSGGPVFTMPQKIHLVGVVTENWESTTYLRSVQEVEDQGTIFRERVHSVVNYGLCVRLESVEKWLDSEIGPEF